MILSLQLYSLRDFMPFEAMLDFCKNKGLSWVEPAGLYEHSAREMVKLLKQHELGAQSFHFGLEPLEENWRELGEILPECGAKNLVMPFADPKTLEEVRELARRLQSLAEKLKDLGVQLHYHNHAHEISRHFEGKCVLDWLLELAPGLHWQVDVGWVYAGGADVAQKMRQYAQRISMLHIKDIFARDTDGEVETRNEGGVEVVLSAAAKKGGQPARIGDGIVEFPSIFAVAEELGINTFILENDNPEDADAFADSGIALVKKYTGGV